MFVRKFISIIFSSLLFSLIVINLIQFARVPLPDFKYLGLGFTQEYPTGYFGVSSVLNFVESLNSNDVLKSAVDDFVKSTSSVGNFLLFGLPNDIANGDWGAIVLNVVTGGLVSLVNLASEIFNLVSSFGVMIGNFMNILGMFLDGQFNINRTDLSSMYEYWESQRSSLALGFDLIKVLVR